MTSISQPDKSIKLPADIEQAIETARNNITVMTAEASRLNRIIMNQQKEIVNFLNAEKFHRDEIDLFKNEIKKAKNELNDLRYSKNILQDEIKKIEEQNILDKKNLSVQKDEISEKNKKVIILENSIKEARAEIVIREKLVAEKEKRLKEFIIDISQLINKHANITTGS